MIKTKGVQLMLGTIFALFYYAIGAVIFYFLIRLAVKHGIQDANRDKRF